LFSWTEWADTLATQIRQAQSAGDGDLGDTYYLHWMNALESLLQERQVSSSGELRRFQDAWERAAERTPHGQPIALCASDFNDR
jgi:nitrile hydratase accessory protein